ncbi:MAG TPA: lysoplasmalogenase [Kofleriaceae bacterium]|nr:lysoplasmalogenase [Kofleriaceae bacterium]
MIGLTIGCALACAVLVVAEWRRLAGLRIGAKLVASAAFVAAGVSAVAAQGGDLAASRVQLGYAFVAALALGAIGDACLLVTGKRWFLAGLVAFLLGHLAYIAGIARIEPWGRWPGDAGWLLAVPAGLGIAALAHLWPRLGALRVPVIAYVATITVMVIAAIGAARGPALPGGGGRLVAGASAFFASDLAVARERFVARSFTNKLWGLPAYYAGQLLLAWSIAAIDMASTGAGP